MRKQIKIAAIILCLVVIVVAVFLLIKLADKKETKQSNAALNNQESIFDINKYSHLDYYKKEFIDRYDAYLELNPDMPVDEVVWRVNAYQDMPKYGCDIPVTDFSVTTIVNKYYKVPDDYEPDDLAVFEGYKLREEAGNAYVKMREDAAKEGLTLYITSAYRSVEYQRGLYNRYLERDPQEEVDRYSARPGYSEHHLGLAIDIAAPGGSQRQFVNTPEYKWVQENCHKYGFIIRYLEETEDITGYEFEPWHIRYVGADVSTDMKDKEINNYEEYYVKYIE